MAIAGMVSKAVQHDHTYAHFIAKQTKDHITYGSDTRSTESGKSVLGGYVDRDS